MKSRHLLISAILVFCLFLAASGEDGFVYYTIQKGDTLYSIARRNGISVFELQEINGIDDPSRIKTGTRIKIPDHKGAGTGNFTYYTIQKGDTLYSIAKRNNIPLDALLKLNNLNENSIIKLNMKIKIPAQDAPLETKTDSTPATTVDKSQAAEKYIPNSMGIPFWPHAGEILHLTGKLSQALEFKGSAGDSIISVSSGKVTWAGPFRGYGQMIFIKSESGYVFVYGGMSELFVSTGDAIKIGSRIGILGTNPHDGKANLFFCVSRDGQPYAPDKAPRT